MTTATCNLAWHAHCESNPFEGFNDSAFAHARPLVHSLM